MGTNKILYLDKVFTATDVKSGNVYQARSPIAASQEIDTFNFDVYSEDTTLTEFIRNTPLTYFHNDEQMGIYYVQKVSRTAINTYHFACTSTVGLLDETYHDGGIYTGETVKEVCEDICSPLTVYVKTNIANIELYGWLPIATRRENLTQVLFAIGATLKVDYNGAIRIEGLWSGEASTIDAGEIYASGTVDYATPVTEVIVTEHAYSQSATETTELFKGTTSAGDKITFDEPCYDLAASGFSVLDSGANWATVSAGSGVLTGKKYTHVTRQVMQQIKPKTRELVTQSDNTVKVESATLVSLVNATAVAERLAEYYSHNERINYKIATKREVPGDVVKIAHPYGGTVSGCIESADITVSGKLAAEESVLIGYKPQDIGEQEYYDTVEVLTEDGTWTVPEGVTSVRVVLIGGGQGGTKGKNGESGKDDGRLIDRTYYLYGSGGNGGEAGMRGERGKVFQTNLDLEPGEKILYTIGAGGAGATQDDVLGENGGKTTFGVHSSAEGSQPTKEGYIDPISNKQYCIDGVNGVEGGKGTGGNGKDAPPPESYDEFTLTDLDGIVWKPGKSDDTRIDYEKPSEKLSWFAYGGLGGGAAVGSNGYDGAPPSTPESIHELHGGDSGAGANAAAPKRQTNYGSGGNGGHGGGGGGGVSAYTGMKLTTDGRYDYRAYPGEPGAGGIGSNGGDGAPGCVLIYYRVYRASSTGRFVTRDGKGFNEKFTRKVVV